MASRKKCFRINAPLVSSEILIPFEFDPLLFYPAGLAKLKKQHFKCLLLISTYTSSIKVSFCWANLVFTNPPSSCEPANKCQHLR